MQRRPTVISISSPKKKSRELSRVSFSRNSISGTLKLPPKKYSIAYNDTAHPDFQTIVNILQKKPNRRHAEEIEILINGTENIKFFMDASAENGPETHTECCKYMTYCHLNKNDVLFEQGSTGYEFYIILSGSVGVNVWLDLPEQALIERKTKEYYTKFIDILYPPHSNKHLTEVRILKAGESFGELALLGGKCTPRSASIIAKEECHFCVLDRINFLRILSIFYAFLQM